MIGSYIREPMRRGAAQPDTKRAETALPERHAEWLERFCVQHKRRPLVLHIGNIGNNAYILGKALNDAGIDSDVLCYDYYHVMGCPEWEEADIAGDIGDQFYPDWDAVDLRGFQRPTWFVQGPIDSCLDYLLARRSGNAAATLAHWRANEECRIRCCATARQGPMTNQKPSLPSFTVRAFRRIMRIARRSMFEHFPPRSTVSFTKRADELVRLFAESFPERKDALVPSDLAHLRDIYPKWNRLLPHYDLVVGYATDGIYPLMASRPYFALEHGTIRSIPFEETPTGRLCALTYRLADHSFITNADNKLAAGRLGLERCGFLPHPLRDAEEALVEGASELRKELRQRLDSDFIVLHPSRQHWTAERHPSWEKGNDFFIEAFARFVHEEHPKAAAVFVDWGQTVNESRALLRKLGVADRVHWIEPQANRRLLSYIQATDVLADQFHLGAFGGTMPKALMLGRPNLIYLDEARHQWCLPEMPPVCNVRTSNEIFGALVRLYRDKDFAQELAREGKRWYRQFHSIESVVDRFLDRMVTVVA